MSSSRLTPDEAARRAESLARQEASVSLGMETQLAHAGVLAGENAALSPPLHFATTYGRPAEGPYREGDSVYSRCDNPTRQLLEREVARLECYGKDTYEGISASSFAFASGMMAASSIILAHKSPLRVILPKDLYHGVPVSQGKSQRRRSVQTNILWTLLSALFSLFSLLVLLGYPPLFPNRR